jgi:hypothetical protein
MHLFNHQVETMAKLKGKGAQQRVVVEHVTVAAGSQAIAGGLTTNRDGQVTSPATASRASWPRSVARSVTHVPGPNQDVATPGVPL